MNILICPDKFKGSMSATEVAESLREGLKSQYPNSSIVIQPLSDGGEGASGILADLWGLERINTPARNPLGKFIESFYYKTEDGKSAVIEMSAASGWELLKDNERNPMVTNSIGTGDLIKAAMSEGAERVTLCIGGSATNDGGSGMASSLGIRFKSEQGRSISPLGGNLSEIATIDMTSTLEVPGFIIAHDVKNPLLGEYGATYTYALQKGAKEDDLGILENGLRHLSKIIGSHLQNIEGMGAAGGMALCGVGLLGAKLQPGFELIAHESGLRDKIKDADLVITGEGGLDNQSKQGKVVGEVEKLCLEFDAQMVIVCGVDKGYESSNKIYSLVDEAGSKEKAISEPGKYLKRIGEQIS